MTSAPGNYGSVPSYTARSEKLIPPNSQLQNYAASDWRQEAPTPDVLLPRTSPPKAWTYSTSSDIYPSEESISLETARRVKEFYEAYHFLPPPPARYEKLRDRVRLECPPRLNIGSDFVADNCAVRPLQCRQRRLLCSHGVHHNGHVQRESRLHLSVQRTASSHSSIYG